MKRPEQLLGPGERPPVSAEQFTASIVLMTRLQQASGQAGIDIMDVDGRPLERQSFVEENGTDDSFHSNRRWLAGVVDRDTEDEAFVVASMFAEINQSAGVLAEFVFTPVDEAHTETVDEPYDLYRIYGDGNVGLVPAQHEWSDGQLITVEGDPTYLSAEETNPLADKLSTFSTIS